MAEKTPAARTPAAPRRPTAQNEISDHTGELDARFLLWRDFCAAHGIPVETLPSALTGNAKEMWEKLKEKNLHKPAEGR